MSTFCFLARFYFFSISLPHAKIPPKSSHGAINFILKWLFYFLFRSIYFERFRKMQMGHFVRFLKQYLTENCRLQS